MKVKNNVRKYRQAMGYTQAKLAKKVRVSRQTIISYEHGRFEPTIKMALTLSRVLDLPVEELFYFGR